MAGPARVAGQDNLQMDSIYQPDARVIAAAQRHLAERRTLARARAAAALRALRAIGVRAHTIGSLSNGRFALHSDVDLLVTRCPLALKYGIEHVVERVLGDLPFDVVYADEIADRSE